MSTYQKAVKEDAELLVELYNKSFYSDYVRYGSCPGYGRSKERMEYSIENFPKEIISCDGSPVGVISIENKGNGTYYLGCLCVIPEYQGQGIGTKAIEYLKESLVDWKEITLVTPADKVENVNFYTKKCGFRITGYEMDGDTKVACFCMKK